MIEHIEHIEHDGAVLAIIIRDGYRQDGITFVTPNDFILQVGHMQRPPGYEVVPHIHNAVQRTTVGTQEVLFVKSGRIRVDFYSMSHDHVGSRELVAGDTIFLAGAGHGIEVLEPTVMIEVKNGPYVAGADKGRFPGKRQEQA